MLKIFKETVIERFCGHIVESNIRPATSDEIKEAKEKYENTEECDCSLVQDEPGWPYDFRACAICNAGLGAI